VLAGFSDEGVDFMMDLTGIEASFPDGGTGLARPLEFEGLSTTAGLPTEGLGPVAGRPTLKYLRILSSLFLPMPRIASKSSTLLNAPYDLRISRIFSAVAGPIPGTNCNSSDVAAFRLIG